jgi:hypothetical protein
MKMLIVVVLWMLTAFAFLGGFGSGNALAQQSSGAGPSAEKLPPDVYPDTLCRMPRPKREDFTTDEEKQAFDRILALSNPESRKSYFEGWLGEAGVRAQIPEVEEVYLKQSDAIRQKTGMELKYREVAVLVATRETNNKSEFLDHATREITREQLGPKVVDIIKNERDTKGLEEKEAVIIQFGRELFNQPKVSSKTFADVERNFGRKATLGITLTMGYYAANAVVMRAYDLQPPASSPW